MAAKKSGKAKASPAMKKHMKAEMGAFAKGKLHSGSASGPVVKSRKQAVAIALSSARAKGLKGAGKAPKGGKRK